MFSFAMANARHICFMGIELKGPAINFVDSLKSRGFIFTNSKYNSCYNLKGIFKGENVSLSVITTPKTNQVCKVVIFFPKRENWHELKSEYIQIVDLYKEKYPLNDEFAYFASPYDEGDGYEMKAIAMGKCQYISFYIAYGGHISVEIDKKACVKIVFDYRTNRKIGHYELKNMILVEFIDKQF